MRVFMLGWEFPAHLSGGIGTACEGLTRALTDAGVNITFVLPEHAGEVDTRAGSVLTTVPAPREGNDATPPAAAPEIWVADEELADEGARVRVRPGLGFSGGGAGSTETPPSGDAPEASGGAPPAPGFAVERVDARIPGAYDSAGSRAEAPGTVAGDAGGRLWGGARQPSASDDAAEAGTGTDGTPASGGHAGASPQPPPPESELVRQTRRYADACVGLARRLADEADATGAEGFTAVHAHDWTTFPAGVAVAEALGVPLILHVHATEYDRNGEGRTGPENPIRNIELEGLAAADRVLAVSRRTRAVLETRYGVDPARIRVVYNAASPPPEAGAPIATGGATTTASDGGSSDAVGFTAGLAPEERVVLFLGRLTAQKGPGYFLEAAKAVLARRPETKFVVSGSGDRLEESIARVRDSGMADRFVFTGFLRGDDVRAAFDRADVYVMPSVSEPFGIAPLEAIQRGVPVIISRQSGVSEVLAHALKVDFWDTEELANQILAVLNHPTLGATLRAHASLEIRSLTWGGAAERVMDTYREVLPNG